MEVTVTASYSPVDTFSPVFEETHKNIGTIGVGQKILIQFKYLPSDLTFIKAKGCGCSSVSQNIVNSSIDFNYTPGPVPPQLKAQGFYTPTKIYRLTLKFSSGIEEIHTISFTATVVG